jgi:hypothetical protein
MVLVALLAVAAAAHAGAPRVPKGFKAKQVGGLRWDRALAEVRGRVQVRSLLKGHPTPVPRNGRYVLGCRWVVHTKGHRDITAGRAYQEYDAIVGVPLGGTRTGPFGVQWKLDGFGLPLPAHHIHFKDCKRARHLEDL